MAPQTSKTYLGDGVYAEAEARGVVLVVSNGAEATDTIVLEPAVLAAFLLWLKRLGIAVVDA
jgi:hypothetical protein